MHGLRIGECKNIMVSYLRCLRAHRGSNDPECRLQAKAYLGCRMERCAILPSFPSMPLPQPYTTSGAKPRHHGSPRQSIVIPAMSPRRADTNDVLRNLMAPDEFKNLGFTEDDATKGQANATIERGGNT